MSSYGLLTSRCHMGQLEQRPGASTDRKSVKLLFRAPHSSCMYASGRVSYAHAHPQILAVPEPSLTLEKTAVQTPICTKPGYRSWDLRAPATPPPRGA